MINWNYSILDYCVITVASQCALNICMYVPLSLFGCLLENYLQFFLKRILLQQVILNQELDMVFLNISNSLLVQECVTFLISTTWQNRTKKPTQQNPNLLPKCLYFVMPPKLKIRYQIGTNIIQLS